jgi:mRNA-degrading endonuclease toxin of MazEF toxin-antitoxin module
MKRGSLFWVNLGSTTPPEFGKVRPALVISNSEQNIRLPTVVILPISSRAPEIWPLRLGFKMPDGKASFVVLPGIRQVSKARLQEMIGLAPPALLQRVEEALSVYLRD